MGMADRVNRMPEAICTTRPPITSVPPPRNFAKITIRPVSVKKEKEVAAIPWIILDNRLKKYTCGPL
jgi:hypothetical protein